MLAPERLLSPAASYAANALPQNVNSPAPNTAGCEARICSVSEVPDRGIALRPGRGRIGQEGAHLIRRRRQTLHVEIDPAQEGRIKTVDDFADALGQFRRVIVRAIAFGEFVGLSIIAERVLVLSDIVEIFAERIA